MKIQISLILKLLVVLTTFSLASCASKNIAANYDFNDTKGKAILFGSVTQEHNPASRASYGILYYRGEENGYVMTQIEKFPGSSQFNAYQRSDFSDKTGRIFVLEVPAGDYAFTGWQVFSRGERLHPSESPAPIKYSLKPGEITYVGNIHFDFSLAKNVFGSSIINDVKPELSDNYDQDFSILKQKYPNLAIPKIIHSVGEKRIWGDTTEPLNKTIDPPPIPANIN